MLRTLILRLQTYRTRRALSIAERTLGRDHPNVAGHLNNLAIFMRHGNHLHEAKELLRRAVGIHLKYSRVNLVEHPSMSRTMNNYVRLLQEMGQDEEEIFLECEDLLREFGIPPAARPHGG